MFRSIVFCSALAVLLTGCTGSEIKIVKESHLINYPNYLVGQAFDNRHACASVDWKSFKDERQRTVVQYTCQYKLAAENYKNLATEFIAKEEERFEMAKAGADMNINRHKEEVLDYQNRLEELKLQTGELTWPQHVEMRTAEREKLRSLSGFRDYLAVKAQWKVRRQSVLLAAEKCAEAKDEVCTPFKEEVATTIESIDDAISAKRQESVMHPSAYSSVDTESMVQRYKDGLESANKAVNKAIGAKDGLILQAKQQRDATVKKSQERLERFESAHEKIQWVVIDGTPKLTGIFVVIKNKEGELQWPGDPDHLLAQLYKNSPDSQYYALLLKDLWMRQE
ncbi:MAG: putative lipoprotein [Polaromonas sp.]|nr:putative lipoprotein [Polaromonas sp.]